jgi:hypothetical protein
MIIKEDKNWNTIDTLIQRSGERGAERERERGYEVIVFLTRIMYILITNFITRFH